MARRRWAWEGVFGIKSREDLESVKFLRLRNRTSAVARFFGHTRNIPSSNSHLQVHAQVQVDNTYMINQTSPYREKLIDKDNNFNQSK